MNSRWDLLVLGGSYLFEVGAFVCDGVCLFEVRIFKVGSLFEIGVIYLRWGYTKDGVICLR